jgi:hypothetical protein
MSTSRSVLAVVGLGAAAPFLAWLVLSPIAGVDMSVTTAQAETTVGPASVLVSGAVASLGALAAAWLARRFAGRPRRAFTIVALAVLVVSLAGPIGSANSTSAALGLTVLHLVVAAVVVPLVARGLPRHSTRGGGTTQPQTPAAEMLR